MWHPRRSERPSPASLFLTCNPTTATLSLPCCSLPAPWKHPTSLELQHSAGGSFCLLSSPAPGTEQVLKTVFEWRNEFLRNPQLSDIKVSANWILFSSKDFAAAECFHTFVKGMKSTYEDLSLFSCLQTHCRQVQGFLAGARPQGTVPGGREGGCGLVDEMGLSQAKKAKASQWGEAGEKVQTRESADPGVPGDTGEQRREEWVMAVGWGV